ncbi:MAG TPA: FtsK/SpoIIIE domain-containing protein [Candidatus Limnocylindrales bacterium]|nr:FtsK/SpoIIIE domain-containing protein [Candidatus Limnocylindrales bacterium]
MSSILSAGKTIELVNQLKATVEECAARADKLNEELRIKTAKERQRCAVAIAAAKQELASQGTAAEQDFENRKVALLAKYEQRKTWIGDAYQSSKERGLQKIEDQIGARKYELQKTTLQAEKDREAALTRATAAHEEFSRTLAARQDDLAEMEREAQRLLKGYGRLLRFFFKAYELAEVSHEADENRLMAQFQELLERAKGDLERLRGFGLFRLLRFLALWLALIICAAGAVPVLERFGIRLLSYQQVAIAAAAAVIVIILVRYITRRRSAPVAHSLSQLLAKSRRVYELCKTGAETRHQAELQRIQTEFQTTIQGATERLRQTQGAAGDLRVKCRMESDQHAVRVTARNETLHRAKLQRLERQQTEAGRARVGAEEERIKALNEGCEAKIAGFVADQAAGWQALEAEWKARTGAIYQTLQSARDLSHQMFPSWTEVVWDSWKAPAQFGRAARFGELKVDLQKLCQVFPKDKRLETPGPTSFSAPLCLTYPEQGSMLIESDGSGHDEAVGALNNIILRLLSNAPPGRLNFTILDPVGLGQNFAGVMHLADYEEQLINSRIWTQSGQIEQKLADLNEHMEKVIQMYLRNEYQTIAEYNEQAGVIAEKYHFLIIADFPANFTDTAAKRLLSIASSGARCGVYTLIHWDRRQAAPADFIPDELRKSSVCVSAKANGFVLAGAPRPGADLILDEPPASEAATNFIQQVGRQSHDSSRVEVPFEQIAPGETELWSEETTNELRVPIGRTGATKLQYLAIGKGTRQHGLIAGKTGSGKSTLFHVIITNLSLWCSPEQVEFYLVDFKKGVEFKCYATKALPHARVVAIESDREFGLSVLQRVDDELKRRGDLFRHLGVQDVAGYKQAGGTASIPRTLLLIDEFQEFFVEDDKIAQTASLLLDRIVRQGRAFGIHVLLGSQTLGGAYTVARTTLGQMVIRIALQCNEADAYLIMDDNNPAPRLLSRPGEGIYNDMAGALQGNSPFQVVWLPESIRDSYLTKVRQRADRNGENLPGPIVFEGNAPADIRENPLLRRALGSKAVERPRAARMWLGAPNSIKGPTEAVFHRQSGNNLLIVGQRDEAVLAMFSVGLVALSAQYPRGTARFILVDATPPGSPEREYLEKVVATNPQEITLAKAADLFELLQDLGTEMKQRAEAPDPEAAPAVFLFIHGLQKYSRLRYEEEFGFSSGDSGAEVKPGAILNDLICEGARLGFHIIATCDSYNNVNRFLSRKALSEFEMRVLFQMSANDSASLIDNPKAGMLGLHRALFYNAQEGYLETFRPYALPGREWVEEAGRVLA